jgi:hypothetical protein
MKITYNKTSCCYYCRHQIDSPWGYKCTAWVKWNRWNMDGPLVCQDWERKSKLEVECEAI